MLEEIMLDGTIRNKVDIAIERLRAFEPEDGYYVAFSGGKDSVCILELCKMAKVKFEAHYNVTSVDPPELVQFIKDKYPEVSRDVPLDKDGKPITMWNLIPKKKCRLQDLQDIVAKFLKNRLEKVELRLLVFVGQNRLAEQRVPERLKSLERLMKFLPMRW